MEKARLRRDEFVQSVDVVRLRRFDRTLEFAHAGAGRRIGASFPLRQPGRAKKNTYRFAGGTAGSHRFAGGTAGRAVSARSRPETEPPSIRVRARRYGESTVLKKERPHPGRKQVHNAKFAFIQRVCMLCQFDVEFWMMMMMMYGS